MRLISWAAAIAIATTMPVQLYAQGRGVMGAGVGVSCGEWTRLQLREQQGHGGDTNLYAALSWLTGYLSGVNEVSQSPDFIIGPPRLKAEGIMGWVDNYCRANPLDDISTAALALKNELQTRARDSK